jgi:2-isopropylmalate synthase
MSLEIYDCTLREGEQAAGASFSLEDRIELFRILDRFGVDFIELGWPIASREILDSFGLCKKIRKNAGIVAFGSTSVAENVDEDANLISLVKSGAEYACIFGKTCREHVKKQLRITPENNLIRINRSVSFLRDKGMKVFYDAEHYFDAYDNDEEYAIQTLVSAAEAGAERIILCDTNGGLLPDEARKVLDHTERELGKKGIRNILGVHFHNDQELAVANTIASLQYIRQVQGTINGLGERVGNLNFSTFLPIYAKKLGGKLKMDLKELKKINEEAFRLSGVEIPEARPFVGDSAFAHKGGVHIDATSKGASYEHARPDDFGSRRVFLLNTLGGRSGIVNVAAQFGYSLDKKNKEVQEGVRKLFDKLGEMEKRGYRMGAVGAEQYLLVEKYFGNLRDFFNIEKWKIETGKDNGREKSKIYLNCRVNGNSVEERLEIEGGPVDSAYKTLANVLGRDYPEVKSLELSDFHVGIARSRKEESSVRTIISFRDGEEFQTVGVDSNILQSAIEALEKGFRYYLNRKHSKERLK